MKLHQKENRKQEAESSKLEEFPSGKAPFQPWRCQSSVLLRRRASYSCSLLKLCRCLCFAAIFFLISAFAAQAAGEIVMKVATLAPQGSEWHKILLEMGAEWQQASNGRIVFRLYPGGVTGDDPDIVRKMQLGTLDAGLLTVNGLSRIDRGIAALEVPLAYADYGELDCVLEQFGSQLEQRMEAKGFIVLG